MSITKNTIANYVGQSYVSLIGIVMLPFYLRYLGAEGYGLVGFFIVMQAWLQLLDMGMSPTLARQVAHERGAGEEEQLVDLRSLLRSIELIFFVLGAFMVLGVWLFSPWIAAEWINVQKLPLAEVAYCITLMGMMVGLRWFASLYRSGIQGLEWQVWLNGANIVFATLRYVGAWVLLLWITQAPRHFFEFQLLVGTAELAVMAIRFYSGLPYVRRVGVFGFSWATLKPVLPFTAGIAYASLIWVLLTQLDKLILSHLLPLRQYGYYALVTVIAGGVLSFSNPISQALLPRMTALLAEGREATMLALYRKATHFVVVLMFPLTGTVALFSRELLYAWTGDRIAADWAGPVLTWFVLGNGLLALASFQYYLQFAHGKLKLHVLSSTVNAFLQVPFLIYAAYVYGAMGVAVSWFLIRVVSFSLWSAIVHHRFAPGIHYKWLMEDITPMFAMTCFTLFSASSLKGMIGMAGRLEAFVLVVCIGTLALLLNMVFSGACRESVLKAIRYSGV